MQCGRPVRAGSLRPLPPNPRGQSRRALAGHRQACLQNQPFLPVLFQGSRWRGGWRLRPSQSPTVRSSRDAREDEGIFVTSPRESKLFTLMSTVLLELLLTGGLFWSPLLCSLLFILISPSSAWVQKSKEEAIQLAVEEAKREAASRVPVTPPESAEFMNRMMAEMWVPFVVPQTLRDNLSAWQEKARMSAPKGWTVELVDFSLGVHGPVMSNFQVFNDSTTGRMQAMECDMNMNSTSMRVVVRGSGPLGDFRATVSGVSMKGKVRVLPIMEHRMLLWSFLQPPDAQIKLQVKGPLIGEREVPQFSFMRNALISGIQDMLVEPRRAAASLDYENIGQQALDTNLNIFVESVNGLGSQLTSLETSPKGGAEGPITDVTLESVVQPSKEAPRPVSPSPLKKYGWPSLSRTPTKGKPGSKSSNDASKGSSLSTSPSNDARSSTSTSGSSTSTSASSSNSTSGTDARRAVGLFRQLRNRTGSAVLVNAMNLSSKLERRSATRLVNPEGRATMDELLKVELGDKDGIIDIQVRDASRKNRVGGQPVFGRARLHVAAAKDGSTLMWCLGTHKKPLAQRWQPAMGPWRVTVPLENATTPGASITLALSTDPWTYAQVAPMSAYKTPGSRTVVLQVLEGKDLPASDWAGTSDPYVELQYDQRTYTTRTLYNSQQPLWNETFVFLENSSLLTRTVRLAVRDNGVADKTESMGIATVNLDMALEATIQDRWVQLGGSESGELRVRMAVVAGAPDSSSVQQMVALLSSSEFAQASVPTLQVVAVAARNLPPRPSALRLPSPNRSTYCGLIFGGSKQVTPVAIGSQNPTWNFSALFPLAVSHPPPPAAEDMPVLEGQQEPLVAQAAAQSSGGKPPSSSASSTLPVASGQPAGTSSLSSVESSGSGSSRLESTIKAGGSGNLIPGANRLKLEVFDVDMRAPGNSLGYVEVDANLNVPQPGDNWEQWLPLRGNNRGAEVLVRIAHLSQFSGNQGALPNPLDARPRGAATMNSLQARRGVSSASNAEPVHAEQILVDSFTEQVRQANAKAVQASQGFREAWGPKVQGWLSSVNSAIAAQQAAIMSPQKKKQGEEAQDGTDKSQKEDSDTKIVVPEGTDETGNGVGTGGDHDSVMDSIAVSGAARETREREESGSGGGGWLRSFGGGLPQGWGWGRSSGAKGASKEEVQRKEGDKDSC